MAGERACGRGRLFRRWRAPAHMGGVLAQRIDGVDLVKEDRHVPRAEFAPHGFLWRADDERLALRLREILRRVRDRRHIIARPRDGNADHEHVTLRIMAEDVERLREHLGLAEHRSRQIERIARGAEIRQHAIDARERLRREVGERQVRALGCVSAHHTDSARMAHHDGASASGIEPADIERRRIGHLADVARAPNPVVAQKCVESAVVHHQGAGVRRGCDGAAPAVAAFEQDDLGAMACGGPRGLREHLRTVHGLDVDQNEFDRGIRRDRARQFRNPEVGIVAGRDEVTYAHSGLAQIGVGHDARGAALAHQRDRPVHRLDVHEHGAEVEYRSTGEIGNALCIRADHPHAMGVGIIDHAALRALAFLAHLGEPRRHDDRHRDTPPGALRHRINRPRAFDRDNRRLRLFRQVVDPGKAAQTLHFGAGRIHRKDLPGESELAHVVDRAAAGFVVIVRCADHGHGGRRQRRERNPVHLELVTSRVS